MNLDFSELETKLRSNLTERADELQERLASVSEHWGYEDAVYRFYHQSFKLFRLQKKTLEIVELLKALLPGQPLNLWFISIVEDGTGREFTPEANANWLAETRPIIEAFFHARYFLEMACRYAENQPAANEAMPSGWAALVSLYQCR